jgi:hypothetical protein
VLGNFGVVSCHSVNETEPVAHIEHNGIMRIIFIYKYIFSVFAKTITFLRTSRPITIVRIGSSDMAAVQKQHDLTVKHIRSA